MCALRNRERIGYPAKCNRNSTLAVIDGVSQMRENAGANEHMLSNGCLGRWPHPLVGHMTLRPCLSQIPDHCPEPHQILWIVCD